MKKLKKRDLIISVFIILAAFCLRVIAVRQLSLTASATVYSPSSQTDMATYWELSRQVLMGDFSGEFYYQPFYYAIFLPAIRWFVNSVDGVIAVQVMLGCGTVLFSLLLGRLLAGRRGGWIAGALTACCTPLIFYTPFLIIANVQAFFISGIGFFGAKWVKERKVWPFLLMLFLLGLAILSRGNAYYIVPAVVVLCFFVYRGMRAVLAVVATFAMILLLQLPFIWHNSAERGRLSGASTASGQVLALGNTPESPPGGRDFDSEAGPMEYPPTFHQWMAEAGEISVAAQIFNWATREPFAFAELQFRKLLLFWDWREIPNNVSMAGEGKNTYLNNPLIYAIPGVVMALAIAGILGCAWRAFRRKDLLFFWTVYLIGGYWAATAAFYNLSRFRAPLFPLLAVIVGMFIVQAALRWKLSRRGFYLSCIFPLLFSAFVVFNGFDFYTENCEAAVMRMVRPNGTFTGNMVLDNGPMSFGGWEELPLERWMEIEKSFAAVQGGGVMQLHIFSATEGSVELRVENQNYKFKVSGLTTVDIPVKNAATITIYVMNVTGGAQLVVDRHRNYGRTKVNAQPVDGELVARIIREIK